MAMDGTTLNMMVAEDNDDDILMLREDVSGLGFVSLARVARDGEECLEHLKALDGSALPDLLLLDINMPKVNGFEVLRAVRGDPRLKNLSVVFLTVSTREEDMALALSLGASAYISKPMDYEDFRSLVGTMLRFWHRVLPVAMRPAR